MDFIAVTDDVLPVTHIKIWGKSGWRFLMAVALTYPNAPTEVDKKEMRAFLETLGPVLPCKICSVHFKQCLKEMNSDVLENRHNLAKWMHSVQNDIRKRQGKQQISYNEQINQCTTGHTNSSLFHCSYRQAVVLLSIIVIVLLIRVCKR